MIEIISLLQPTKFKSPASGKWYLVPEWIEIPANFDMEKELNWIPMKFGVEKELGRVKASKGNEYYIITQLKKEIKCTCAGFKYRGMCKHIQQFKLQGMLAK